MQVKYFIRYIAKSGKETILITKQRNKKYLMDLDALKKLFSVVFLNPEHKCEIVPAYSDPLHGDVYEVKLSRRDIVKAFSAARQSSFNYKKTRIQYLRLNIDKDDIKELTCLDICSADLSLIHFIEFMKAKSSTIGYRKLI